MIATDKAIERVSGCHMIRFLTALAMLTALLTVMWASGLDWSDLDEEE